MKKRKLSCLISIIAAISLFAVTAQAAEEQDFGVVQINGDEEGEEESEPASLDDIKLEEMIEIEDVAEFTPLEYEVADYIYNISSSGKTAEFLILYISLVNLETDPVDFNPEISDVKVTYNDKYQYAGWTLQQNPDNGYDAVDSEDQFPIDPMYEGFYMVGCTLPNAVIEGKESLVMTFTLLGNEVTYNIR